jgi:hypothetical protein
VTRPNERAKRPLSCLRIEERRRCKWSETTAPGEAQSGIPCRPVGSIEGVGALLVADAGGAQGNSQPTASQTARLVRHSLRQGESPIIDIAKARKPTDQRWNVGIPIPSPTALAKLSLEVSRQFRSRGRKPRHIAQTEFVEARFIERADVPGPTLGSHRPFCATVTDHHKGGRTACGQ